jgi:hypothetical protein
MATRATENLLWGVRSNSRPFTAMRVTCALPTTTENGGRPATSSASPARKRFDKTVLPLPSTTSTQDSPLKVKPSTLEALLAGAADAAGDFDAADAAEICPAALVPEFGPVAVGDGAAILGDGNFAGATAAGVVVVVGEGDLPFAPVDVEGTGTGSGVGAGANAGGTTASPAGFSASHAAELPGSNTGPSAGAISGGRRGTLTALSMTAGAATVIGGRPPSARCGRT